MLSTTDGIAQSDLHKLEGLLREFGDVIAVDDTDLGQVTQFYHTIDTGDARPIRQPPRRLPFHQRHEVRKLVDDMLKMDVIEPGQRASPVVLVRKRDGTTRFCVEFRKLNEVTHKDAQPLSCIDDTLDSLGGARYFSTLDLATGYWQVTVDPKLNSLCDTYWVIPISLYAVRPM